MCPFYHRPMLAAALATASVVFAAATPQRLRPAAKTGLLQTEDGFADMRPAFESQWFAEDAQKMEAMPPFPQPKAKICKPICTYQCEKSECDQTCEPVCLPPQCETLCTKSADKCETRCNKPKCAVICPLEPECPQDSECPKSKCRTICAPPACTTSCSGSCHSVCSQPQCNWKCKAPLDSCKKPACKLNCPDVHKCDGRDQDRFDGEGKVPLMPGMDIKSQDKASLDPTVLTQPVEAPPPPQPQVIPQAHKESSLGFQDVPPPMTTPSPVKKLKMRWKAQDTQEENESLLRR